MEQVISEFLLEGSPISCERYGSGHINETYLLVTNRPHLYILQKVNTRTFPDAAGLMHNIILVTEHIRKRDPDPRHALTLVPTVNGEKYLLRPGNELWRLYEYITGSICLNRAETAEDLRQSGAAFGAFQRQLSDFPAEQLREILPGFHNTPGRFQTLHRAAEADKTGRGRACRRETDFYLEREADVSLLTEMLARGDIPLRVTHNDTKLNNVMLDERTRTPLCVIDLDTVMPGLAAYDFGDSIRFGASTAAEDERDLNRVHFSMELFRAYAEGFLGVCGENLNEAELETMAEGARLMTLECGARFLTDYLDGDVYFHTSRPEHNLDRARTQMRLAEEMEARMPEMLRTVRDICPKRCARK